MVWIWIVFGFFLFFTLLFLSKLHIKIDYFHTQDNDNMSIMVRLWFIRYTFNIPLVKIDKESNSLVLKRDSYAGTVKEKKQETEQKVTPTEFINLMKNTQELLQHVVEFHSIVKKFLNKITIQKLEWHSNIGAGDAALTGTLVGAGWSIKGCIIGILSQYMKLKAVPNITITPFFQQMFSHTKLTCIFSFRIGNAILAGLRVVKFWKGGFPSFKSNTPSFIKSEDNEKSIV
ncbi:DUF2953 domain-containing protein [Bacillus salitolerans]|uniref:DUF2953 domain-containing protein n=1 Tax=Bacillus salitolerans TaxID=1437434 RepID=A0ABW4LYW6_9BACI